MRGNGLHYRMPRLHVAGEHYSATPRRAAKGVDRRTLKGQTRAGYIKWLDEHGHTVRAICERLGEKYGYVMDVLQGRVHLHGPSIEPPPVPDAPAGALSPAPTHGETMSYSFKVRAKAKAAAIEAAEAKFLEVTQTQTWHRADRAAMRASVSAFVNALGHQPGRDIEVVVNGSVSVELTPPKDAVSAVAAVEAREATETEPAVEAVEEVKYQAPVPEQWNTTHAAIGVSAYFVPEDAA